jgi:hypothetical protein
MSTIGDRLADLKGRIAAAEARSGRPPGSVALLAVSKTRPAADLRAAWQLGQRAFGESRVQEALAKQAELGDLGIEWHFIGPLQANKTRPVAEHFAWVHSVDRLQVAERLSRQRPQALGPLQICVQVNVSGEATKSGVAPEAARGLCEAIQALPGLRLRGLMAVPAPAESLEAQRAPFAALRTLWEGLRAGGLPLDTLSAGMTADLEAAIAEGSTMVRIGTALFGPRPPAS